MGELRYRSSMINLLHFDIRTLEAMNNADIMHRMNLGNKDLSAVNQVVLHAFVAHHVGFVIWTGDQCLGVSDCIV